jgi:Ca2+-binding RTX toxin-like protein
MRRVPLLILPALLALFIAAPAGAHLRFVPADEAICKKRNKQGTGKSETTHLSNNKRNFYNGGDGNDKIFGGKKDDIINGGRGNDIVHGGGGNDVVCGGLGNDKVYGDEGRDRVFGEEDDDALWGGPGNDEIGGQAGKDKLYGYGKKKGKIVDDGKDALVGSFVVVVLIAGGRDSLNGGADNDTLYTRTPDIGVKKMDGYIGDDTITGSDVADGPLLGGDGDDTVRGGGGNDSDIDGGGANDTLFGGNGDDHLLGGDGIDVLSGEADSDDCDGGAGNNDRADNTCEKTAGIP